MATRRIQLLVASSFDKSSNCKLSQLQPKEFLQYPLTTTEKTLITLYNDTQNRHIDFWKQQNLIKKEDMESRKHALGEYHKWWRQANQDIILLQWRCILEQYLPFLRK